jgi:argininosuccinate lyase
LREREGFLWGGVFSQGPAPEALAFTASNLDRRLFRLECRVTLAHARALTSAGLLSPEELERTEAALAEMEASWSKGEFSFLPSDEDVHTAVERALRERVGDVADRLRLGRSRNDRIAAELRLWLMEAIPRLLLSLHRLERALFSRAEETLEVALPAYTHLQRAQPSRLAHHLLAHFFALARDFQRLEGARERADASPLGAGAAAGSRIGLDWGEVAREAGFSRLAENSLDAVGSRDFALEFLAAACLLGLDLSRLAEEICLWSTREFAFLRLPEAYSTGSSVLPQKRNPDVAELARAGTGRLLGAFVHLATVAKALPLAYNRDLQEDKGPVFAAADLLEAELAAMAGLVEGLAFERERMEEAAGGEALAQDAAELLALGGVPYARAHRLVGEALRELAGKASGEELLRGLEARLGLPRGALEVRASLAARKGPASPGREGMQWQLELAARELEREASVLRDLGLLGEEQGS